MSRNYPPGVSPSYFDEPKMQDCPKCEGSGRAECDCEEDHVIDCPECDGSGEVAAEVDNG